MSRRVSAFLNPVPGTPPEVVFYDGGCGLCHATVRFVLHRDRAARFVFAPLGGETFRTTFPPAEAALLPTSVIVRTNDGQTLVRSDAVVHLLRSLGGGWGVAGALLGVVPRALRNVGYRGVARVRARLAAPPRGACAVPSRQAPERFLP